MKPQMRQCPRKREAANTASRFLWRRRLSACVRVRGPTSSLTVLNRTVIRPYNSAK